MATINGTISWGIEPSSSSSSNFANMSWGYRGMNSTSCNLPIVYQIIWSNGTMRELSEPSKDNYVNNKGDIVNIIFDVYVSVEYQNGTYATFPSEWKKIGSVKKSRDLPNKNYDLSQSSTDALGHRFTIDVSQLLKNEMSYSLCPIGKGTWQNYMLGGMNGGKVFQDNVTQSFNNPYIQDMIGCLRMVKVVATAEIINSDGEIEISTTAKHSNGNIRVLNTVHQWDNFLSSERSYFAHSYNTYGWGASRTYPRTFQSTCPNLSFGSSRKPNYRKPVRRDEWGEFLYWYQGNGNDYSVWYSASVNPEGVAYGASNTSDLCDFWAIRIVTEDSAGSQTAYLTDFTTHLDFGQVGSLVGVYLRGQHRVLCQNVSLPYIEDNAVDINGAADNPITSTTTAYRLDLISTTQQVGGTIYSPQKTTSHAGYKWYVIDTEKEGANPKTKPTRNKDFVVFHWLNRGGGISSYTAKRNLSESVSASRTTIDRKNGNRLIWQDDQAGGVDINPSLYLSDSMRGGNYYKGGREVLGVEAQRSQSVFTDPLHKDAARWLEEIITSPNVWVETETNNFSSEEAGNSSFPTQGIYGKTPYRVNPYLRPTNTRYSPVIITNSDVETVNTEKGLVQMNFTYTFAHKIETQSN